MTQPLLKINGPNLQDPAGNNVILRGVSSMGMAMVYGDKANPGTYVPMTVAQYVDKATAIDATGQKWNATSIRLCYEPFPCADPGRLYTSPTQPYSMPEQIDYSAWAATTRYDLGLTVNNAGNCYQAIKQFWAGDKGQPWNLPNYQVGDVVVGLNTNNVYQCTVSGTLITGDWTTGPSSQAADFVDGHGAHWKYIGLWGTSGTTGPTTTTAVVNDGPFMQWRYLFPVTPTATRTAAFNDWQSKVLDPSVQRAVDNGLYAIICMFDFGPAHHPLRSARMKDFWSRMATSKWANHPQVIFELWNESEDIGSYQGGPGSWATQKPVIQATCDMIRASGANNIILVPPPFFSAWLSEATSSPLIGTNIGYTLHQYKSQYSSASNQAQINQGLASGQAVFMTEWGDDTNPTDPSNTWTTVLRPLMEPSEGSTHPACATIAWSLSSTWFPGMFTDGAFTQPNPFGQAVRQWFTDKKALNQPSSTGAVLAGTVTADSSGNWSMTLGLASGVHTLTAQSSGATSNTVNITIP